MHLFPSLFSETLFEEGEGVMDAIQMEPKPSYRFRRFISMWGAQGKKEGSRAMVEDRRLAFDLQRAGECDSLGSYTFVPRKWATLSALSPLILLFGAHILGSFGHPI